MNKTLKILGTGLVGMSLLLGSSAGQVTYAATNHVYEDKSFKVDMDSHNDDIMQIADGWTNGDMFNCTWRKDNVSFRDGKMNLTINKDKAGSTTPYSGSEYRTRDYFGYGMFETSMKPIKNDGVVSSFFTYTGPSDGTKWDEIDIEFLGKDTTKVQFNYFTDGKGNHEYLYDLGFDASKEFHTYGFEWKEDSITWYVDSKPVYTATSNIPNTPGKIMMNVWPGTGVDSWLNAFDGKTPLVAQYDYFSYKSLKNTEDKPNGQDKPNNQDKPNGQDKPSVENKKVDLKVSTDVSNSVNQEYVVKSKGEELDLSKLTIRYYFTKGDSKNMHFWCDNAEVNLNEAPWYRNVTSKVEGNYKTDEKGSYVELKVDDKLTLKPNAGALKIKTRLANEDWSSVTNFTEGKVVVLYDGKVIA